MAYRFYPILTLAEDTPFHPPDPDEPQTRRLLWRSGWLAFVAIIPFLPTLGGGSIWLDDALVFRNPALKTAAGLGQIWFHPRSQPEYHSAATTAVWLEYHAFGSHPFGYHLVTLALHVTTVVLLWLLLRRLAVPGAWLAAAVFAAHPVALQSVGWICRQENVLGAAAFFGSILAALVFFEIEPPPPAYYLDRFPELRKGAYTLALLLFAVAALSIPAAAVVVPVLLVVILWWKRGIVGREQWITLAPVLLIGVTLAALQAWIWATSDAVGDAPLTATQKLTLAPTILSFYALKAAAPYPILFVYPRWLVVPWQGALCAAAIVFVVSILAWRALRRPNGPARGCLAAAWVFVGFLIPALAGWRGEGTTYAFAADFLAYPAIAGVIVPLIVLLVQGLNRLQRYASAIRLAAGTLLVVALIVLTWSQALPYRDEVRLWDATIRSGGSSAIAYERLGLTLLTRAEQHADRSETTRALDALRKARSIAPNSARAATYLGLAYESLGQWPDAIAEFRGALAQNPANADVYLHLAGTYARIGNLSDAEANYRSALKLRPDDAAAHNSLGLVLALGGRLTDAIDEYNAALEINPHLIGAMINLADAEYRRGNFDVAARALQKAIDEDPKHPNFEAVMNAGFILHQHREYAKAEQMFKVAVEVSPRSPEAHNALGMVQAAQGHLDEAILQFEQALDIKPDYEDARRNVQAARQQRGR